jgi:TM2 domain-containing membrane protein YozV
MKNKYVAAVLAFFFGWLGAHKFYLNKPLQGVLHLIFWPIGSIIAFIEAIQYLTMSQDAFDVRHNMDTNAKLIMREKQALYREKIKLERMRLEKQRIKEERGEKEKIAVKNITGEQADELAAWKDLLNQGIIDEVQYEEKRKIILGLD